MFVDRAESSESPYKEDEDCAYPKKTRFHVTARMRRTSRKGRLGLAGSPTESARIAAGSLLIEQRDSHDLRGPASIALIESLLSCRRHFIAPNPSRSPRDGILASQPHQSLALRREPRHLQRTAQIRQNSARHESHAQHRRWRQGSTPGVRGLTEFGFRHILWFDAEATSSRVQERNHMRTASAFWRRSER